MTNDDILTPQTDLPTPEQDAPMWDELPQDELIEHDPTASSEPTQADDVDATAVSEEPATDVSPSIQPESVAPTSFLPDPTDSPFFRGATPPARVEVRTHTPKEARAALSESRFRRERAQDEDAAIASLDETVLRPIPTIEPIEFGAQDGADNAGAEGSPLPKGAMPSEGTGAIPYIPPMPSPSYAQEDVRAESKTPRIGTAWKLAGAAAALLIVCGAVTVRALGSRSTNVGLTGLVQTIGEDVHNVDRQKLSTPKLNAPARPLGYEDDEADVPTSDVTEDATPTETPEQTQTDGGWPFREFVLPYRSPVGDKDTGYEEDPSDDRWQYSPVAPNDDTATPDEQDVADDQGGNLNERWRLEDGEDPNSYSPYGDFDPYDLESWYTLLMGEEDDGSQGDETYLEDEETYSEGYDAYPNDGYFGSEVDYDDLMNWYYSLTDLVYGTSHDQDADAFGYDTYTDTYADGYVDYFGDEYDDTYVDGYDTESTSDEGYADENGDYEYYGEEQQDDDQDGSYDYWTRYDGMPYTYDFDDEGFTYTYGDETYTIRYDDIMRFFGGDWWSGGSDGRNSREERGSRSRGWNVWSW